MIIISHRGNLFGPNKELENSPEYIENTISQGFDVEVDVWVLNDKIYLGHDSPEYSVELPYIISISNNSWFHCKNINALLFFINNFPDFRFFWHQEDDYTLTSNKLIWTYPNKIVTNKSIIVDLEGNYKNDNSVYGICTDYPIKIKNTLSKIIDNTITNIPKDQLCQAFDPMMFLPEKTSSIIDDTRLANKSCFAPAYVYIEGSHGKRFLCDYHYHYEKNMTMGSKPLSWPNIAKIVIDERERIKETFMKNVTTTETINAKCSIVSTHNLEEKCAADAFVKVKMKNSNENNFIFYCNFHFRKNYYRYYSNNVVYENIYDIVDERYRMIDSIVEESEKINLV